MDDLTRPAHLRGQKHRRRVEELSAQQTSQRVAPTLTPFPITVTHSNPPPPVAQPETSPIPPVAFRRPALAECKLCDRNIPLAKWNEHLHDPLHVRKARMTVYHQALEEGSRDKFGVSITQPELDFGIIDISTLVEWPTRENVFYIRLLEGAVLLKSIGLTSQLGSQAQFRDSNSGPEGNRGLYEDRVEFTFQLPLHDNKQFVIWRPVKATVTVKVHQKQLAPTAPYTRPKRRRREKKTFITDGIRPSNFERQKTAFCYKLPESEIPEDIRAIVQHGSVDAKVDLIRQERLPADLEPSTYPNHWQTLLWLEEYQAEKDMEHYDQADVAFVEVPGLAERRPSVVIGDSVLVRRLNSGSDKWFRGFVHGVQQNNVMLGFSAGFSCPAGQKIDVEFELNRLMFRRMHMAVISPYQHRPVLFPEAEDIEDGGLLRPTILQMNRIAIIDPRVRSNPPQLQAATAIAQLPRGAIPFIVFGPPGTGKTVTVVEAIRQILARNPKAKILACAPSNNAADIIADRLCDSLSTAQLLRLNAPSRVKTLPRSLESYSLRYDDGSFRVPVHQTIMQYRVVVSTCASGSLPHGVGVPNGHFTHIFIDEAGQASEPEVMIPIQMNGDANTTIVLAGDPKQLGPVIRSPVARRLGLDISYLDRLMAMDMYKSVANRGATLVYVKLIKNWRSHRAIIDFPNQQFYDGELEACADPSVTDLCLDWDKLSNPKYPIIFHAIKGQDLRESSSPSWFNIEEASAVRDYVRDLRYDQNISFNDEQIGVITPYRAQVRKLRTVLKADFPEVKVGTTEEFQGDERNAIIVSTVRSSLDFVEFDLRHTLGFVANPRRFNVAMTRAKSVLIIIGDPDVLGLDPLWRRFLNQIHTNGGWKGQRIPWDPAAEVVEGAGDDHLPYDAQVRAQSELDLRNLVARTSAMGLEALDEVEELEADADLHWHEDE
ncbi:hypothetical protein M407DRAFT_218212 [Tulasnella calospora MUT 4182]|uniref:RNA helicase n=1 Tax=Tulasnella calospora MUT 4182 TaxID=1051891 RepID=A0A0C3LJA6_9AGAM|nr:hypothetical protein M407DRAFT_218212 [Tulasnella calospora MUT 4182]